jgi:hypothetical protein
MTRRLLATIGALALLAVACSSTPAATPVADPAEIVAQSLDALGKAKTVHLRADVTGTIPFDMSSLLGGGTGASPAPGASEPTMDLGGSYVEATVDIAGKQAQATIAVPPILGLKLDLIQIGDTSYTKINLMGDTWEKSTSTPAPDESAAPSPSAGVQQMIDDVKKALSAEGVKTEKLADEKCGDADCYHVKITAPPSALSGAAGDTLGGLGLASPEPGASPLIGGDVVVELWARKSDMRPVKLVIGTTAAGSTLAVTMVMDKYDETVTITAPPADQVTEGGGLQLPSLAP